MFRTFQIEFCLHDGHSGAPVASYREQAFEIALSQLPGLLPSARGRDCSGR
jgi:hypothetical protein